MNKVSCYLQISRAAEIFLSTIASSHGIILKITMRGAFFMSEQVKKTPCCTGLLAHV